MATIDQQFVEYIVKTLVNNPDKVSVERKIDEKGVLLSLTVDPEDVGRVIGKRGVTAQSIRMLLRALGTKQDARYNLKIVNTDEGGEASHSERRGSEGDTAAEAEPESAGEKVEEFGGGAPEDVNSDEGYSDSNEDSGDEYGAPETSGLAEKTRAELADLDDLDI